ncbi:hypothetical protein D3C80_1084110 [compost metagenome]
MKHEGYNYNPGDGSYQYKYQGQERQDELGLNWDSFKWRNYDYAIGRFMSIDPLAEEYEDYTPYQFASNQPVHANEVEGLENAHDLNKRIQTRESRTIVTDAISRNTQMNRTVERALSAPSQVQTASRQQPMLSKGSTPEQSKANAAKAAGIERAKNVVSNHDNLGSPHTQNSVMVGAGYGALDVATGEVVGKVIGGISKLTTSNSTNFFRAVSKAELDDIATNGLRTTEGGYETSKLFTTTAENATEFGKLNYGFDGVPNTIIQAKVPNSVIKKSTFFNADGMPAVSIPAELLQKVKNVKPLNSSPINP